jgi:hypothetical protein
VRSGTCWPGTPCRAGRPRPDPGPAGYRAAPRLLVAYRFGPPVRADGPAEASGKVSMVGCGIVLVAIISLFIAVNSTWAYP